MTEASPADLLRDLWRQAGLAPGALGEVVLEGREPALPSSFRIGALAQATIGASAAAAAAVHRARGGPAQAARVGMRHAAVEFHSERYLALAGGDAGARWDNIAGTYRCGDGRYVRLHTNFPHHRAGTLALLGCEGNREAVAAALSRWEAFAFEEAAAAAGMCVSAMRSFAEWDAHPQGQAVAALPPLRIERIGDAPPTPLPPLADRPLAGLRVLELTRVIAGPVCGRTLAAHGADVLHISAAHLPSFDELLVDTGRGKRTARLDLRDPAGQDRLRALAAGADIFLQGYRPGAVAGHGFDPASLAALRPGIVCTSLSAYGEVGPWGGRRGFDSLVQTASGFNHAEAEAAGTLPEPKVLPCQALDHASGYLLAFGTLAALLRRAEEGGSWLVRVSLAGTGAWLRRLGRLEGGFAAAMPRMEELGPLLEESESGFGRLTALRHAGQLDLTPPRWVLPSMPLGSHAAEWA
ncbi:CoA transferase [Belnapia sp. T6]|uniref:CoA transferase n=1 Tax=Belnapia mucosa TaxID=2804532 RepID=A0ABS1V9B5_9PROT|nr:CoA transferase [Belnapia mucosa]MBL6457942.1 CoA transferase [Belnapia mucosa]